MRLAPKAQFEKHFCNRLYTKPLKKGQLVLVRNSERDAGLADKYSPRYSGPYIIDRQTKKGAYVLKELDGTFMRQGFAAFRLLPYSPRVPEGLRHQQITESPDERSTSDPESEMTDSASDSDDPDYRPP